MMSSSSSSLFVALRSDTEPTSKGPYIHQATTARTVAVLYQLGCNLDTTHYGRTRFSKCWDSPKPNRFDEIIESTDQSDEILAMLIYLGATWVDRDRRVITSADALVSAIIARQNYRALEAMLQSGRVDAESTTTWDKWLIEALPDPAKDVWGTHVFLPSANPDWNASQYLLRELSNSGACEGEWTVRPRRDAINDHCDCLRVLLEYGGNPNARDADGKSLLQLLILRVCNVTALELLLRHGADPNERLTDVCEAEHTYKEIVQHDRELVGVKRHRKALSSRKRRRSSGCEEPATAVRLGFPYRHDDEDNCKSNGDGKRADDGIEGVGAAVDERADEAVDERDDEEVNDVAPIGTEEDHWLQMEYAFFVWLWSQSSPELHSSRELHCIVTAFFSVPTFDPSIVSSNNTTLFAAVCETGDAELVEMYFGIAERRGILIDVNARSHQVPICLLDRSGNVLPSLLQRGLSLDGSFVVTESRRKDNDFTYYLSTGYDNRADFGTPQRYDVPRLLKRRSDEVAPESQGGGGAFSCRPEEVALYPVVTHFEGDCIAVPRELKPLLINATTEPLAYRVCVQLRGQQYFFSAPPSFISAFEQRSVRETFITWALLQLAPPAVHALLRVPTVDVDSPNGRGMYPLHIAAQMHGKYTLNEENNTGAYHSSFVGVFQRCRHVDVVNDEGNNVLHHLAVWGSGDRLGYCLGDLTVTIPADATEFGVADVDIRRKQDVLRSLINRPNHAGHTPLTLAVALGYGDLAPLLMRHGADITRLTYFNICPLSARERFRQHQNVARWDHDTLWTRHEARADPPRCPHCTLQLQPAAEGRDLGIALIGHRTQIRVTTDINVRKYGKYAYY